MPKLIAKFKTRLGSLATHKDKETSAIPSGVDLSHLKVGLSALSGSAEIAGFTPLSKSAEIVKVIVEIIEKKAENAEDIKEFSQTTTHLLRILKRILPTVGGKQMNDELFQDIKVFQQDLEDIQKNLEKLAQRTTLKAFWHAEQDGKVLTGFKEKSDRFIASLNLQFGIETHNMVLAGGESRQSATITYENIKLATPTAPRVFTGRDKLVTEGVEMLCKKDQAHLAILGAGGMGKTSLALHVTSAKPGSSGKHLRSLVKANTKANPANLANFSTFLHYSLVRTRDLIKPQALICSHAPLATEPSGDILYVRRKFQKQRYFLPCEVLPDAPSLIQGLLQILKISISEGKDGYEILESYLQSYQDPILLVLDNFETPWYSSKHQKAVQNLIEKIHDQGKVSIIITMRGGKAVGDIEWDKLGGQSGLPPLALRAAREAFLSISPTTKESEELDVLLNELDCMPLAVILMAQLSKRLPLEVLIKNWAKSKTDMLRNENQDS
ncbi:hypothetical protein BT96DRAFT_932615 [Gymnopus androsaceus JB14]|uniref:Novel STAND NTPase 1 domain-containing protein n=1 Tax=Gymnopus androsaceus JB14 TaxID=1447944 RepID=A0A6A4ICJ4_9AGAR|nr:hypothetical protein BT96DRAFT_932615 [Gymnopus androsaceus JB14]